MFWRSLRDCCLAVVLVGWLCLAGPVLDAQQRAPNETQKKGDQRILRQGGDSCTYQAWLEEDVHWIISDAERAAFNQLSNDIDRDMFIEQFWIRRDPTPDTYQNEFKEEHYRRIAYSNQHFGASTPGWKRDRGRAYIVLGPPDEIDSHPARATEDQPQSASSPPEQVWRYRYRKPTPDDEVFRHGPLKNANADVILKFVDTCRCGDYRLVSDPPEKDYVPSPEGGPKRPGGLSRSPTVKFKELQEIVTHKIAVKRLPFNVATDFVKGTTCTLFVPITVQINNQDIRFVTKAGGEHATINVFGRLTSLTGRVVETFEDTLNVNLPSQLVPGPREGMSLYRTEVLLRPGRYRLDLVVQDVNGDRIGTWSQGVAVPAE